MFSKMGVFNAMPQECIVVAYYLLSPKDVYQEEQIFINATRKIVG